VILLARHGETESNRERRFQGQLDVPLSERGREQARELAEVTAAEGVRSLFASPLSRALETARIVGERIDLEPRVDPRLVEVDVGDWEGRLKDDVAREDPDGWAAFRRAGDDWRFPGGESLREQQQRVVAALADVSARGELPALVVCHRGVIRCALAHARERGLGTYHEWRVPNGELVRL
jgi:broad specificity phosphatase PhoE